MSAELTLDLPWVKVPGAQAGGLTVRRGRRPSLAFDDGIVLDVLIIDPASFGSASEVIDTARSVSGPGRVVLVAGAVPVEWRAELRLAEVSFFDVSGVAEINWPRVQLSARQFGRPIRRRRSALPLQKSHALVAQEVLIRAGDGDRPTIGELAEATGVSVPTASRAVSQLAEHGLVAKRKEGTWVSVDVVDRLAIAERLAERSGWPGGELLEAFQWGRTIFDVAARLSAAASKAGVEVAVTGRVGAAYLGVLGTSSPDEVRCWAVTGGASLGELAEAIDLEPAAGGAGNVVLCSDPWRVGVHRRAEVDFDDMQAWVAHPLRVWCDLHDDRRGSEFAAQMWSMVSG